MGSVTILKSLLWALINKSVRTIASHTDSTEADMVKPRLALYFAGSRATFYQLTQWLPVFETLLDEYHIDLVVKKASAYLALRNHTSIRVVFIPQVAELERYINSEGPRCFFYVNQNVANFTVLRFTEPLHVFLNHGESEKSYMFSSQVRAYDYAFVAGPAARKRLTENVRFFANERIIEVGRPPLEVHSRPENLDWAPDLPIVLYAPTWEGDRDSMQYSSVVERGVELVGALIASGKYSVVYRPHPLTGSRSREYWRASERIKRMLKGTNRRLGFRRHLVNTSTDYGWQLREADHVIADVSSVFFDALSLGKDSILCTRDRSKQVDNVQGVLSDPRLLFPEKTAVNLNFLTDDDLKTVRLDALRKWGSFYSTPAPETPLQLFRYWISQILV